jgi:hypothetical protein
MKARKTSQIQLNNCSPTARFRTEFRPSKQWYGPKNSEKFPFVSFLNGLRRQDAIIIANKTPLKQESVAESNPGVGKILLKVVKKPNIDALPGACTAVQEFNFSVKKGLFENPASRTGSTTFKVVPRALRKIPRGRTAGRRRPGQRASRALAFLLHPAANSRMKPEWNRNEKLLAPHRAFSPLGKAKRTPMLRLCFIKKINALKFHCRNGAGFGALDHKALLSLEICGFNFAHQLAKETFHGSHDRGPSPGSP